MTSANNISTKPLVARSHDGSLIGIHIRNPQPAANSSSNNNVGLVRCYDGSVSSGALKFTLRFPLNHNITNKRDNDDNDGDDGNDRLLSLSTSSTAAAASNDELRKLVFATSSEARDGDINHHRNYNNSNTIQPPPPSYLCGMCQSSTIHIWDLERGVLAQTFDARTSLSSSASAKKKKKQRKSSSTTSGGEGKEILCDIVTAGNQLYALMFFPAEVGEEDGNIHSNGKCRVYQYKLDATGATLVKKIKVGSVHAAAATAPTMSNVNTATSSSSATLALAITISNTTMIIRMGNVLRIYDVTTGDKLCKMDVPADIVLSSHTGGGGDDADYDVERGHSTKTTLLAPLACTCDGRFIVASIHNQAVVFHHATMKKNDNTNHSLQTLALLSTKDDSPISYLDLSLTDGKKLGVLAFQQRAEVASLFAVSISSVGVPSSSSSTPSSSLAPQMPKAQLLTNEKDTSVSFLGAGFHPRKQQLLQGGDEKATSPEPPLQLLFQRMKHSGGSAAGSGTTLLPMEFVYDALDSLEGIVIVGKSLLLTTTTTASLDGGGAKSRDNKRKVVVAESNVALAPGDQGHEALLAMDLSQGKKTKKPRASSRSSGDGGDDDEEEEAGAEEAESDGEDDFPDDLDEDGEHGQSIAERLALLSSAMEETDDEEDDDDDDDNDADEEDGQKADSSAHNRSKFKLNSATSETLTSLLTQALSSNDPTQLNIALQVTDRRLVEGTVRSLQALDAERARQIMLMMNDSRGGGGATAAAAAQQTRYIPTLMAHIVRRMARRHSLVMPLGVWIKAILAATARSSTNPAVYGHNRDGGNNSSITDQIMAKEGRDMARALGPLKNFLNERVDCFAQMLRLDGRLALLNQQL